jgi:hypothetical protein
LIRKKNDERGDIEGGPKSPTGVKEKKVWAASVKKDLFLNGLKSQQSKAHVESCPPLSILENILSNKEGYDINITWREFCVQLILSVSDKRT